MSDKYLNQLNIMGTIADADLMPIEDGDFSTDLKKVAMSTLKAYFIGTNITLTGYVDAGTGFKVNGTEIIDSSSNLTNIGTVGCGNITTTGYVDAASYVDAAGGFRVGGVEVINTNNNLSNILNISMSGLLAMDSSVVIDTNRNIYAASVNSYGTYKMDGTEIIDASKAIVGVTGITVASGNIVLSGAGATVDGVDVSVIGAASHARSHSISSSSDHTFGANLMYYTTNGSALTGISHVATGSVLKSAGATSAPEWGKVTSSMTTGTFSPSSHNNSSHSETYATTSHKGYHQNGGSDEITVEGLSGKLADAQTALSHNWNSHSDINGTTDGDFYVWDSGGWSKENFTTMVNAAIATWIVTNGGTDTDFLTGEGNTANVTDGLIKSYNA